MNKIRLKFRYVVVRIRFFLVRVLSFIFGSPLVPNPVFRYPRNTKCFCGSRKKFKHCCERKMPKLITRKECKRLKKTMDNIVKEIGHDPFTKENGFV